MASSKLVVNNLSELATEDDLKELFFKEGPVDSVDFESSTCAVVKFRSSKHGTPLLPFLNRLNCDLFDCIRFLIGSAHLIYFIC